MSVFARLSPRLQQAIVARLGWSSLRPVQEEAGDALLAGSNAVVLAPTAGGKTEAAMFPTLSGMVEDQPDGCGGDLHCADQGVAKQPIGAPRFVHRNGRAAAICLARRYGHYERRRFLADPTELLMTTPESLEVMLVSERVDESRLFQDLRRGHHR